MENPIEARKRMVQSRIEKSFNEGLNIKQEVDIEKAVYSDTPENRKLGRVGQEYGGRGSRGGKTDEPKGERKPAAKENDFVKKLSSQSSTRVTPNLTCRRLRGADLKHIVKTVCIEKTPSEDDIKGFNEKFGTKVGLGNFKKISSSAKGSPGHVIFYNTKTGETSSSIPKSWVSDSVSEDKLSKISNKSTL